MCANRLSFSERQISGVGENKSTFMAPIAAGHVWFGLFFGYLRMAPYAELMQSLHVALGLILLDPNNSAGGNQVLMAVFAGLGCFRSTGLSPGVAFKTGDASA